MKYPSAGMWPTANSAGLNILSGGKGLIVPPSWSGKGAIYYFPLELNEQVHEVNKQLKASKSFINRILLGKFRIQKKYNIYLMLAKFNILCLAMYMKLMLKS